MKRVFKQTKNFFRFYQIDSQVHVNSTNLAPIPDTLKEFIFPKVKLIKSQFPKRPNEETSNELEELEVNVKNNNPYFKINPFNYPSVRLSLLKAGFKRVEDHQWNIFFGRHLSQQAYQNLNPFQKTNHFPGSINLGRKDLLTSAIHEKKKIFPIDYDFFPDTFLIPFNRDALLEDIERNQNQYFILKPNASSCGRGIKVLKATDEIPTDPCVIQRYVHNPLLVNGFKFDLRLYVVVTSYDPLIVYLYPEGLVRFSTEKYDLGNISSRLSHLTNFSLNKHSKKFVVNQDEEEDDQGSKWSISALKRLFESENVNHDKIWNDIENIIIKTLIAVEPLIIQKTESLNVKQSNCFELYGFDVLLDENYKPHLLEVNILPSLACPSPLDKKIKTSLLSNIFHMVGIVPYDRDNLENEKKKLNYLPNHLGERKEEIYILHQSEDELNRIGEFKRIFPTIDNSRNFNQLFVRKSKYNELLASFEEEKQRKSQEDLYKEITF